MADIRINSLPTTASASSSDDFLALDGATNGTRKLNAYSPTFGGNVTASGNLTVSGVTTSAGISNSGALTFTAAIGQVAGSIAKNATYGLTYYGVTGSSNDNTMLNASGAVVLSNPAGTTNATLTGNLTVSGTTGVTATDLTLGSSGPSVKSTLSARAPRQGLVFDGTAGATGTAVTIGTADLTFSQWVRVPSTVSETRGLFLLSPAGSIGATSLLGYVDSDATLNIHITGATSGDRTKQTLSGFVTSYAGKWVNILFTRVGSTWTGYINGVATTFSASTSGTAPTWAGSISGAVVNFGSLGSSGAIYNDAISAINLYNRALSASEVVALYEAGAPAGADYNSATNTSLITGDNSTFASDTGYWTLAAGATISGGNLNLAGNGSRADRTLPLSVGKKYRAVAVVTANTATDLILGSSTGGSYAILSGTGTLTGEFVASSTSFTIYQNGAGAITVDSITLVPMGLLLAPDAAQAGGGLVWYDTSGNAANITLPASGVSWNVPSSSYWGGQLKLQSTTGTNGLRINNISSDTFGFFGGGNDGLPVFSSLNNATIGSATYGWLAYNSTATGDFELYRRNNSTTNTAALIVARSTGNLIVGGAAGSDGGQKLQVSGTGFFSAASGSISNVLEITSNDQSGNRFRITNSGSGGKIWSLVGGNPGANNADFTIYDESNSVKALVLTAASGNATFAGNTTAKGTTHYFGADNSQRIELTSNNGSSQGLVEFYNRGTSAYFAARYLASSHTFEQGPIAINNTVQTAASVASTHKVTISIGGSTYYLLATNV